MPSSSRKPQAPEWPVEVARAGDPHDPLPRLMPLLCPGVTRPVPGQARGARHRRRDGQPVRHSRHGLPRRGTADPAGAARHPGPGRAGIRSCAARTARPAYRPPRSRGPTPRATGSGGAAGLLRAGGSRRGPGSGGTSPFARPRGAGAQVAAGDQCRHVRRGDHHGLARPVHGADRRFPGHVRGRHGLRPGALRRRPRYPPPDALSHPVRLATTPAGTGRYGRGPAPPGVRQRARATAHDRHRPARPPGQPRLPAYSWPATARVVST